MPTFAYTVGQIVHVMPQSLSGPTTTERFEVVRRFSASHHPDLYWIRSMARRGQRMVAASDLSSATPNRFRIAMVTPIRSNRDEFDGAPMLVAA